MNQLLRSAAIGTVILISFVICSFLLPPKKTFSQKPPAAVPKIQAAILLDVSGSMNGLIEQAKAQLWNMVTTMGKVDCNGQTPTIEIALYEYGRPGNGTTKGYVKQISAFTGDLDLLSQKLFSLTIDGGDEYCGQVIYTSVNELKWDTASTSYKVIFIAGNEDFLQGSLHYSKACIAAKTKGIIVNTIYCGDKMQGITEHWNLAGECGSGSFTNINQNVTIDDIPTPYDSQLITLNGKLNNTYIGYGMLGTANKQQQVLADSINFKMNTATALKRGKVKSNAKLYKNSTWDLVDGYAEKGEAFLNLDLKALPDSLRNKSKEEIKTIVTTKSKERNAVQQEMATLNIKRDAWLVAEKAKNSTNNNQVTLESEIEKIIKEQVKRFNMKVL